MSARLLIAASASVTILLCALSPGFMPRPAPAITSAPQPQEPDSTNEDAHAVIAAASLGLSPETLAASGYSAADAAQILSTLKTQNAYAALIERCTAHPSGGQAPSSAASRAELMSACIANDPPARRARLSRCIAGVAVGLPAALSVGCGTTEERRLVSEALVAEQRATSLGGQLAERHLTRLTTLRSSTAVTEAENALATQLGAIQTQFATTTPHP